MEKLTDIPSDKLDENIQSSFIEAEKQIPNSSGKRLLELNTYLSEKLNRIVTKLYQSTENESKKVYWQGWTAIGISFTALVISIGFSCESNLSDKKWQKEELSILKSIDSKLELGLKLK